MSSFFLVSADSATAFVKTREDSEPSQRRPNWPRKIISSCYFRTLLPDPASISHHVAGAVTHLFHSLHGHCAGNGTEHTLKVHAHHAFILRIHGGGVHLV